MAKSAVCHSGRFAAKRPTRSPGFTPSSKKACDNPAMRRRNSFDEISCQPAPIRNICARGLGHVSMACKRLEGSVPELMVWWSLYLTEEKGAIAVLMTRNSAQERREWRNGWGEEDLRSQC